MQCRLVLALAENFNNNFPEKEDPLMENLPNNNILLQNILSFALDPQEKEKLRIVVWCNPVVQTILVWCPPGVQTIVVWYHAGVHT